MVLQADESFLIPTGTPHVVAAISDRSSRELVLASLSVFAHLVETTGTLNETEVTGLALFMHVSSEIGDEILGVPRDLL